MADVVFLTESVISKSSCGVYDIWENSNVNLID